MLGPGQLYQGSVEVTTVATAKGDAGHVPHIAFNSVAAEHDIKHDGNDDRNTEDSDSDDDI